MKLVRFLSHNIDKFLLCAVVITTFAIIIDLKDDLIAIELDFIVLIIIICLITLICLLLNRVQINRKKEKKHSQLLKIIPSLCLVYSKNKIEVLLGNPKDFWLNQKMSVKDFEKLFTPQELEKFELIKYSLSNEDNYQGSIILSNMNKTKFITYYVISSKILNKKDEIIIWLIDSSSYKVNETELLNSFHQYRAMSYDLNTLLDKIPLAIWKCSKDRDIFYCNKAYHSLLYKLKYSNYGSNIPLLTDELKQSTDFKSDSSYIKKTITVDEQSITLAINEINDGDQHIGHCLVITEFEQDKKIAKKLNKIFSNLIEQSDKGLIILDSNENLIFFNSTFADFFDLPMTMLYSKPKFSSTIDVMRERGKLPEVKNYKEFKNQQLRFVQDFSQSQTSTMYLSYDTAFKIKTLPFDNEYIVILYEDISNQLKVERRLNEQVSVINSIINTHSNPLFIISQDMKLKHFNSKLLNLFRLPFSIYEEILYFDQILALQTLIIDKHVVEQYKSVIIEAMESGNNNIKSIQINHNLRLNVDINHLTDNSILVIHDLNNHTA